MFRLAPRTGTATQLVSRSRYLIVAAVVSPYTFTPQRMLASTAGVVALMAVVIGGLALARTAGRAGAGNGRREAILALVLAPIGMIIGALVVATAKGGLGTGNGLGGGVVAMIVGLIGITLGGLALRRSRRARLIGSDHSV